MDNHLIFYQILHKSNPRYRIALYIKIGEKLGAFYTERMIAQTKLPNLARCTSYPTHIFLLQCNILLPFSIVNIRKSKQKQVRYNVLGVWYFAMNGSVRARDVICKYKYVYKKTMKRYPTIWFYHLYIEVLRMHVDILYIEEEAINPNRCCNPSHQVEPIFWVWVTSSHACMIVVLCSYTV